MKKLFTLLFSLSLISAHAVEFRHKSTVTITNAPTTNGVEFIFNGDTRIGTNALTSTTFATNTTIGGITTNLYRQIIRYPFDGVRYVEFVSSNEFILHGKPNVLFTNTIEGDWASVVIASNNIGEKTVNISVPVENWPDKEDATNAFTQLVDGINTHSTSYVNKTTNGVNYGGAFSSPGSGSGSEQFAGGEASGNQSIAIGGIASGQQAIATGVSSEGTADFTTSYGSEAKATAPRSSSFGYQAITEYENSTSVGYQSTASTSNQVMLGTSTVDVYVNNRLTIGGYTVNPSHARTNNTVLANGNNAAVDIADRGYVKLSGPSGAFAINGIAGGSDGRIVTLQNSTGYTLTIAHDSGTDPTAANRIYTGTGGDVVITNNPGFAEFIYDSETSRWGLKSYSN